MNHMRKFVVGCAVAVLAFAFAGVGTAAAEQSTFCKANETPCASGNHYASGTEFVLKSKGAIKWATNAEGLKYEVSCTGAEFKGKTTTTGGSSETVEVSFTSQFLSGCNCSFSTLQLAKMKFNWTSGTMNASVTTNGLEYSFTCETALGQVTCAYGGEIKEGATLTGGNPAVLTYKEAPVPKTAGNFLCGTQAKLSVEFEVAAPKPLYVSNA
jgi:hypothetical protein